MTRASHHAPHFEFQERALPWPPGLVSATQIAQSQAMATLQPNKNLTPTLTSDLEALRDDLNRARQLAAEAQTQVDGKTGDIEALQLALQKSFDDLSMLRNAIEDLRRERHFFANEAMRSAALEIRITDLTVERDNLQAQLNEANEALDRLVQQVPAFP